MSETEYESEGPPAGSSARELWIEVGAASVVVFVLVLIASLTAHRIPFISGSVYVVVAAIFVYLPWWWIERLGLRLEDFGLTTEGWPRDVGWGLLFSVLTLVPFAVGFWVWETQWVGHTFAFEWNNYRRWAPKLDGEPEDWGSAPGVWIWTQDRRFNVGMRPAADQSLELRVEADRPMRPQLLGPGQLTHVDGAAGPGRRWRVSVPAESRGRTRLQVAPSRPGTSDFVGNVAVEVVQPRAIPIRAGPAERRVDGEVFETGRGLRWLGLWLMTQLLFIALPEEFFYRGYLQTRVGHAIEAARREGDPAGGDGDAYDGGMRTWWGISEANVIASVIFGLGHLLIPIGGQLLATRISVALPALLFGWLRDRTGSITASVVYHAACNMMVLVAAPHFF